MLARQHLAAVGEQKRQHVELLRRQCELLAVQKRLIVVRQDGQLADGELFRLRGRLGAAQELFDADGELARGDRLRQIIVRADLQPDDAVDVLAAGAQHNDRHVAFPPQRAADLVAVHAGQHHVQHDGVRGHLPLQAQRALPVISREHADALRLQIAPQALVDDAVVVADQNRVSRHGAPPPFLVLPAHYSAGAPAGARAG